MVRRYSIIVSHPLANPKDRLQATSNKLLIMFVIYRRDATRRKPCTIYAQESYLTFEKIKGKFQQG